MDLTDIKLKDSYSSDEDNIVCDFYNPVLSCSVSYDRITGYFSPSILAIASRGFAGLISNHGRIRILTSIQVNKETYDAINESESVKINEDILKNIDFNIDSVKNEIDKDYLRVFMYLYKTNSLDMRVALLKESGGILHQKVGIVRDASNNALSFSGSNNETPGGVISNVEEFKVFKNWIISSSSYFANDESKFEKYWNNRVNNIKVVEIGDALKNKLIRLVDPTDDIKKILARIKAHEQARESDKNSDEESTRTLRGYQQDAINHWTEHSYKSTFEMATGTGKTFTAINALKEFRRKKSFIRAVVVVPLTTLTVQWQDDIRKIIPDLSIINTSTNSKWKDELNNIVLSKKLGRDVSYILITTYSMFTKKDFNERVSKLGGDIILLADEMHNLVNENRIKVLSNPSYKYKLGLSATPTRLWQQDESLIVRQHFGDNSYQYSLEDAIKNKFLVPYNYNPLAINLTIDEYERYLSLSREISRISQMKSDKNEENSALQMKLIERSRIKKNAENKLFSLEKSLKTLQRNSSLYNTLIYVDNEVFLHDLQSMLTENNIRTTKFTGNNSLDERMAAINNLRNHSINAIIAIKCLDEGVDIPSAKLAFFLSNNTDPREYVQRLGRVLRLDKQSKKTISEIYDYIVVPPAGIQYEDEKDRKIARNMIKNELIRAKFFNELSTNSVSAQDLIDDAVDKYGFYFEDDELLYTIGEKDELTN